MFIHILPLTIINPDECSPIKTKKLIPSVSNLDILPDDIITQKTKDKSTGFKFSISNIYKTTKK